MPRRQPISKRIRSYQAKQPLFFLSLKAWADIFQSQYSGMSQLQLIPFSSQSGSSYYHLQA
jgi:hypothetical protein